MNSNPEDHGIGARITRYSAILAVSGILCKILLLVYTVLAVDILGKEQFGRIEYFIEMAIIFSVLVDFGLEQTVTREIARRRGDLQRYLYPLLTFRLAASLFSAVLMTLVMRLLAQPGHTWLLLLSSLTYLIVVTNIMLARAIVRSFELMAYEGLANIIDKVIHIGLAILVLFLLPSLPIIVLCYTAGSLAALAVYMYVILTRFGLRKTAYTLQDWIEWQKKAVPIGLSAACILLLHREDTAMVNWIRGDAETGLYRAPYRFLEGLFLFPQVIAISAYPVFSKLFHEKRPFQESAALLLRGLILMSLPMAIGGLCVADEMMLWLTPELGAPGGFVFKLLLWSLPFIYANFLLGTILNAANRQHLNVRASAWGLFCNALFNIPAIYYYGAFGASIVTVLTQGLYCILMLIYTRDFCIFQDWRRYASILFSCLLMYAALSWLDWPWYASIPGGIIIYVVSITLTQGLTKTDINNLLRVAIKKSDS
ncbi:MAG: flippase [Candidatus Hinthialibacter sp.]